MFSKNLLYSSAMHFLVDGVCACSLFMLADELVDVSAGIAILTYNILAFMTQPLTGWWTDVLAPRQRDRLLVGSVGLLAIGSGLAILTMAAGLGDGNAASWLAMTCFILVAIIVGIGNSLFHVWGGKQTAVETGNDIRALGVFVSTGAMGLSIGILFHARWLLMLFLVLLVAIAYLQVTSNKASVSVLGGFPAENPLGGRASVPVTWGVSAEKSPSTVAAGGAGRGAFTFLAFVAIMLVVLGRSYYGETFSHGFEKDTALLLTIATTATVGKMAGGWLARGLGLWTMVAAVLVGIIVCALFRTDHVLVMLAGLFLINTTMPVTLWLANRLLPGREGLAFGLLAAVLVPGYLLAVTL